MGRACRAASRREFWRRVLVAGGGHDRGPAVDPRAGAGRGRARGDGPRRSDGGAAPAGGRAGGAAQLGAAHRARQGARRAVRRARGRHRLRRRGGRPPLPCRLSTEPDSWRALLLEHRTGPSRSCCAHRDFPVDDLRRELGLTGPVVRDRVRPASGDGGDLAEDTVLRVGIARARRHALAAAALPDRRARRGLRRPDRRLPPHRARADRRRSRRRASGGRACSPPRSSTSSSRGSPGRTGTCRTAGSTSCSSSRCGPHPDAVAAVHGDRQWTYRELNARANRLGRALLARGLRREGVVAVVTERNLDWMAAVLAVFKAGGVYLPIEPHFPADRIATTLSRAGCGLVLTEPGSTTTLDQALDSLPGRRRRCSSTRPTRRTTPRATSASPSRPDQLAYIYFTSGSTGEPKGAMCEHAGMLNHLYAKIDDLEIGEGQVVAQTAPAVLRHLAVAAGLRAPGRWAHPADRAGGDPGRRSGSSTRSSTAGSPCCRSCRRTSRSCCPTSSSTPASCRTCGACRSPARR